MENDLKRLQYLSSFSLQLDQQREDLQPIVELAKYITRSPICEINILDSYNRLTIAGGIEEYQIIPKEQSICRNTVSADDTQEIKDLQQDDRYKDHFYVKGDPWLRYYCGVQMTTSDGINIGTVCVLDTETKQLSEDQINQLKNLADLAIERLEERMEFKQLASDLDDLKDEFHKLNHDLRSPINGIIGVADMLIKNEPDEEVLENLHIVKDCAEAIIDEIDGVLKLVDEKKEVVLADKQADLSTVFEKINQLYKPLAQGKNIALEIDNKLQESINIPNYYAVRLIQIMGNLVGNGLKFTPEGGVVKVKSEMGESEEERILYIDIKDNGEGMSTEQVEAFNQNKKVKRTKSSPGEASYGMGLQNVRNLIAEQGGTVEVEATGGTHFSISLPL